VEVCPQQKDGRQPAKIDGTVIPARRLEKIQGQNKKQIGEDLGPDGRIGETEKGAYQDQRSDCRRSGRPPEPGCFVNQKSGGQSRGIFQSLQTGRSQLLIKRIKHNAREPFVIDPEGLYGSIGENVGIGEARSFPEQAPERQIAPQVGIGEGFGQTAQNERRDAGSDEGGKPIEFKKGIR